MNKLLEVREYDIITCNNLYKNNDKLKYLPEKAFFELEQLIYSYGSSDDNADMIDFFKVGSKKNIGKVIFAGSYVGTVQLKCGYQIQVLPKIALKDSDNERDQTEEIFVRMLASMKDFPWKNYNDANLKIGQMSLYEIFIALYLQKVWILLRKGLKAAYIFNEDNLSYFKGKLIVSEHVRQNLFHKERMYVCFDEYKTDCPENRLIKSALLILRKLTGSSENIRNIRRILTYFEDISPSNNYPQDFTRIRTGRDMKDYEELMRWTKVILLGKSFIPFSGSVMARSMLFPMERVFESYVAKYIRIVFGESGWDVSIQDKGYYLFDNPKRFALRPDIVLSNRNYEKYVMDTKWKVLRNDPYSNYGISQADMYQMYAYSKKYMAKETWLLYPLSEKIGENYRIQYDSEDGVRVRLFMVDLTDIVNSLTVLKRMLEE